MLCMALNRNCCTFRRIDCFLMFVQMELSVSIDPLYWSIAAFASARFFVVVGHGLAAFCEFIPLYAIAWVMAASLAPCRSNLTGIARSMWSGSGSRAPSLASLSLSSFPSAPLCPFTHWNDVVAVLCFRVATAALKMAAFFTPIHPMSSQFLRCVVRPLMMYFESVIILSGQKVGMALAAAITVNSLPTWFDCAFPSTHMALFRGSPFPNHIPLPHCVFSFPLLKHTPSVYIVTFWWHRFSPMVYMHIAGISQIRAGSVNTLKHLAMSVLQVMEGSNRISLSSFFTSSFLAFLHFVSDRLSWGSPSVLRLNFCVRSLILFRASVAHLFRSLHPFNLSSVHSVHAHLSEVTCGVLLFWGFRTLVAVLHRSAIILMSCLFSRHFAAFMVHGHFLACKWCQAGIFFLISRSILMAARLMLCFPAILISFRMSSPSVMNTEL